MAPASSIQSDPECRTVGSSLNDLGSGFPGCILTAGIFIFFFEGSSRSSPSARNLDPWQGQSQVLSAGFHWSRQPDGDILVLPIQPDS